MSPAAAFLIPPPAAAFSHATLNGLSLSSSPTCDSSPAYFYHQFHTTIFSASQSLVFYSHPEPGLSLPQHPSRATPPPRLQDVSSNLGLTAVLDASLPQPCCLCASTMVGKSHLQPLPVLCLLPEHLSASFSPLLATLSLFNLKTQTSSCLFWKVLYDFTPASIQ